LYSGIGLYAAKLLARINPTNRLILVARTQEKADNAKAEVVRLLPPKNGVDHSVNVIPLACDHCSFESIRAFPDELKRKLDETYTREKWIYNGIDVLCLNAAVLVGMNSSPEFTEDGYEVTFQTNHLAPFLLLNLVEKYLNPGGRVVVTTSGLFFDQKLVLDGVRDSETGEKKERFVMADGSEFHFKRCYALSKLCNLASCLELEERLMSRGVVCNYFSPGLMLSSGLFRWQDKNMEVCKSRCALSNEKSVLWGAGALVYMAIADAAGIESGMYWRDAYSQAKDEAVYGKEFCSVRLGNENMDSESRAELWRLSCEMTGLPCSKAKVDGVSSKSADC
jgi:NAD(P)-dependent dehydrogenase (short-subunit alcohol dehydrogenase family)